MRLTLLLIGLLWGASPVVAQVSQDLVLTTDGGMLRGQIVETVPGDHVTILLLNGESRVVPWGQVRWFGPEADRPSDDQLPPVAPAPPARTPDLSPSPRVAPPAQTPPSRPTVTVDVRSDPDGLVLYRLTRRVARFGPFGLAGPREQSLLCTAPCQLSLVPDVYALAIGNPLRRVMWVVGGFFAFWRDHLGATFEPGRVRRTVRPPDRVL